jgi:hypothetical protein
MMARAAGEDRLRARRTRTGQALLMNGVDHVEPHTAIRRSSIGCRRFQASARSIRRCPTTWPQ